MASWDNAPIVKPATASPTPATLHPFDPAVNKPRPNADGSISTEITRTVQLPSGEWANVPSLWWGDGEAVSDFDSMDDDQLAEFAQQYEAQSGHQFPRFKDLTSAEGAAVERSHNGGGTQGVIDGAPATASWQSAPIVTPAGAPAPSADQFADLPIPQGEMVDGAFVPGEPLPSSEPSYLQRLDSNIRKDSADLNDMVTAAGQSVVNAVTGPGRALQGEMNPEITPEGGVNAYPDAMVSSALDTVGMVAGNGPGMAGRGMMAPDAKLAQQVAASATTKAADEFGIPLTQGQARQSLMQMTKEQLLRQGDGNAAEIMRGFDDSQREAVTSAAAKIGETLGTGADDMGATVMGALNKIASDTKAGANELYDRAFGSNLKIRTSALGDLPGAVAKKLYDDGVMVDTTPGGVTPVAAFALQQIDNAKNILSGISPSALPGDGAQVTAVNLRTIEQLRKRLVQLQGNSNEDRAAVAAVKRGFDEWLDNTVDRALITGDDEALKTLADARAQWSEYKGLTTAKQGDGAQQSVVKMQKQDATAEEVANWLYGANIASPNLNAPKVASRIKSILGDDSEAWGAVRAGAFERLTTNMASGETLTPTMISKRIDTFLNDKGQTLSKVLFNDEERQALDRFSTVLKTTVPPRDSTNPSRTAYTVLNAGKKLAGALSGVAGTLIGGPAAGFAAALTIPVFKAAKDAGAAKRAITAVEAPRAIAPAPISNTNVLARAAVTASPDAAAGDDVPPDAPTQTIDGRSYFQKPDGTWWEVI